MRLIPLLVCIAGLSLRTRAKTWSQFFGGKFPIPDTLTSTTDNADRTCDKKLWGTTSIDMDVQPDEGFDTCIRSMDRAESWFIPLTNVDERHYCLLKYKADNDCQCVSAVTRYWGKMVLGACMPLGETSQSYQWLRVGKVRPKV
jgi:hypothetical protein